MKVIKVVLPNQQNSHISQSDKEMDKRAIEAVKHSLEKAQICKKPIAKYDLKSKSVYLEYSNGEKKYVK